MELVNSSVKDIEAYHDFALSFTEDYKFGVQFMVTKVLKE